MSAQPNSRNAEHQTCDVTAPIKRADVLETVRESLGHALADTAPEDFSDATTRTYYLRAKEWMHSPKAPDTVNGPDADGPLTRSFPLTGAQLRSLLDALAQITAARLASDATSAPALRSRADRLADTALTQPVTRRRTRGSHLPPFIRAAAAGLMSGS